MTDSETDAEPDSYSFERYLEAKRTVDSRALNRRVSATLYDRLDDFPADPHILEVGAGTGPTIERALEWPLRGEVRYMAVETDPDLVETAVENVAEAARRRGLSAERSGRSLRIEPATDSGGDVGPGNSGVGQKPSWDSFSVEFLPEDAFAILDRSTGEFDLVVGQAFVDLTDVETAVDSVFQALRPGGLAYFPITFDGTTAFEPTVDPDLDERIERRYHRHVDTTEKAGGHTGDSRAGRRLFVAIHEAGGRVLAAGGSDWIVHPTENGYVGDEAYFLHHLVETVRTALVEDDVIGSDRLSEWARRRHRQIAAEELIYLTHQLDVLACSPDE